MNKIFKSEEEAKNLSLSKNTSLRKRPESSDNFSFYTVSDENGFKDIVGFFKDTQDNWHCLDFGQWIHLGSEQSRSFRNIDPSEIEKQILNLRENGHLVDSGGRIYYMEKDSAAKDTGFICDVSGSYLDENLCAPYIFKDSFVIASQEVASNNTENNVNEDTNKYKLYKRQKDGSYKQIYEADECIFQKEGFAVNVYFSGGTYKHPKANTFFADGEIDESMKKKVDIAIKLEQIKEQKDSLAEKETLLKKVVNTLRLPSRMQSPSIKPQMEEVQDIIELPSYIRMKMKLGKTGNSDGTEKKECVTVAEVQTKIAKKFMLDMHNKKQKGK